jgi:DNA-binding transcriptional LysR family regulator
VRTPHFLAAFHRRFPQVALDLSTGPSGELIDAVLEGRLAGAFVDGPVPNALLDSTLVFDEELVLISASPRTPIQRERDVDGANIYAFRSNCSYRRLFERWFQNDNAAPGWIFELESYHGMPACVSAGAGLAVLPKSNLLRMPYHASVTVNWLAPAISQVSIHLVWRHGLRSPALTALLEIFRPSGASAPVPAVSTS